MNKGRIGALLPILVFLVVFAGSGILFEDFYAMPTIVGFLIALLVAFLQNPRRRLADKLNTVAQGMGESNIMLMCLIFVMAGAFSGIVQAAGGVESTVNFGLSIMPPGVAVAALFVIAAALRCRAASCFHVIWNQEREAAGLDQKMTADTSASVRTAVEGLKLLIRADREKQ